MLIFADSNLRKRILNTALPAMLEMVLYMFIGIIDIVIVGRLGSKPLAAVSLGAQIFLAVILFLSALGTGSCVLVAHSKGSKNIEMVRQVAAQTFTISILLGILTSIAGLLGSKSIISLFSIEPYVFQEALKYLHIVFWIAPLAIGLNMTNGIFRGLGRTDIPMKIAIAVNIINTLGDYLLVYGKLGMPALGVSGAAYATSLAHLCGFSMAAYVLFSGNAGIKLYLHNFKKFELSTVNSILTLGLPSLGEQFTVTLVNLLSMFLIVFLGTLSFASHQVAMNVESISFMPGYGIAVAATSLVGHAIGSRNRENTHKTARACLELAILLMGVMGLFFFCFPRYIASFFTTDSEMIYMVVPLLRIAALEQLPMAITLTLGGILKGTGNTRVPMVISIVFICFFRFPLMYLMIHVWHLSLVYIWLLFVVDWVLRSITYLTICSRRKYLKEFPHLNEPA